MVTIQRAASLYLKKALGEKLIPKEIAELDEYESQLLTDDEALSRELLKDL
jgi:hypothetical protein